MSTSTRRVELDLAAADPERLLELVDGLARLELAARRLGWAVELSAADPSLQLLLDRTGLAAALGVRRGSGTPIPHRPPRSQPVTTPSTTHLDPRFSSPGASATPWAEAEAVLRDAELFWISTVRRDGRPHVTPLLGVWVDGALHVTTGPGEQKHRNLTAEPRCAISTGQNRSDEGLDLVLEGSAVRVVDDGALQALAEAWVGKYGETWRFAVAEGCFVGEGGPAHVFAVRPDKVLGFAKGEFAQTRWTFGDDG